MAQQFFARIMHWVANEIVVERLANSRAFQRFAVRTNDSLERAKTMTAEKLQQHIEDVPRRMQQAASRSSSSSQQQPLRAQQQQQRGGGLSFFEALKQEVAKDFGKGPKK